MWWGQRLATTKSEHLLAIDVSAATFGLVAANGIAKSAVPLASNNGSNTELARAPKEGCLARCPNGSRPLAKLIQDELRILRATQRSGDPCGCSGGHHDHLVLESVG
ncbi:MAG: hypothetical protein WCQ91_00415 [Planctomycetota bacterium]